MRPHSPSGERGRESESQCGAFCLLNGDDFCQRPEVPVDCPLLGIDRLGNTTQKHCRSGDVLASPSKLWGVILLVHDAALDLVSSTSGAARWVARMGRNVLRRARVAADSSTIVVAPRRALVRVRGPPHEGPEGCESVWTPLPLAAVLEHPP